MHLSPDVAFLLWIPLGAAVFARFPVRVAILLNFLGGWGLLPGAGYAASASPFPYWILGVCLPSGYWLTKATVTGFAALLGVLLFDSGTVRQFRPRLVDAPMLLWCLAPLFSAVALHGGWRRAAYEVAYLAVAWAAPWLLGRIYFSGRDAQLLAARAFVLAGLFYVPICLIESRTGPQFYAWVYGYEPYRWIGAARYFGFRPVGFLEDGDQLGIWMAGAALLAVSLSVRRLSPRMLGVPMGVAAALLCAVTVLCQSWSSILTMAGLLLLTLIPRPRLVRAAIACVVFAAVAFVGLRLVHVVSLRALVADNAGIRSAALGLRGIGRGAFGWRLGQDELHLRSALARPAFGTGSWSWWQPSGLRPWDLWLLVTGMFGLVGLLALALLELIPALRMVWFQNYAVSPECAQLRLALAALLLLTASDQLLNGTAILPVLLIAGGLSLPEPDAGAGCEAPTGEVPGEDLPPPAPA